MTMQHKSWLCSCSVPAGNCATLPRPGILASSMVWCVQVLIGNKCDMDEHKRVVPYSRGQALADEYRIQFYETSAKNNIRVEEVRAPAHQC